jgi:sulfide:quinone oxidoreductase
VAVDWRKRSDIEVDIAPALKRKGIESIIQRAKRVHPDANQIELEDGSRVDYDYLVIATGPKLAFDEIEGLGPHGGHTQSVCHVSHAETTKLAWDEFVKAPGPIVVGAVQGASCFGPAYEFAMIMDTDLRKRKIRDQVPMTYVTPEPYIGHLGLGGVGDSKGT